MWLRPVRFWVNLYLPRLNRTNTISIIMIYVLIWFLFWFWLPVWVNLYLFQQFWSITEWIIWTKTTVVTIQFWVCINSVAQLLPHNACSIVKTDNPGRLWSIKYGIITYLYAMTYSIYLTIWTIYGGYPIIKRKLSEGDIITWIDMHVNPVIKQPKCSKTHLYNSPMARKLNYKTAQ